MPTSLLGVGTESLALWHWVLTSEETWVLMGSSPCHPGLITMSSRGPQGLI